jgi:hypothetical protein
MTVIELAKLLSTKISQGKGNFQVAVFQWHEGSQLLGDVLEREGRNEIELYSKPEGAELANPEPEADEFDELI